DSEDKLEEFILPEENLSEENSGKATDVTESVDFGTQKQEVSVVLEDESLNKKEGESSEDDEALEPEEKDNVSS
ncbi:hypothetical protein H8D36_06240, partial [archaeon]|nr:hypothetical protein [archaeon]